MPLSVVWSVWFAFRVKFCQMNVVIVAGRHQYLVQQCSHTSCLWLSFHETLSLAFLALVLVSYVMLHYATVDYLYTVLLQVDTPPFSELPCVLELDTFGILVSLHYAHSTLYTALTAPPASHTVNGVVPALEGMTDQHLIRITAAAHILQYLLSTPPPPHADTRELQLVIQVE